jgi:hypothetical protein
MRKKPAACSKVRPATPGTPSRSRHQGLGDRLSDPRHALEQVRGILIQVDADLVDAGCQDLLQRLAQPVLIYLVLILSETELAKVHLRQLP